MTEQRNCVECSGVAHKKEDSDTLFVCQSCGVEFMDNPQFNKRFSL
jgi:DNA-directed RNA polymerase subunit M/transcription elongation factor TFIIS